MSRPGVGHESPEGLGGSARAVSLIHHHPQSPSRGSHGLCVRHVIRGEFARGWQRPCLVAEKRGTMFWMCSKHACVRAGWQGGRVKKTKRLNWSITPVFLQFLIVSGFHRNKVADGTPVALVGPCPASKGATGQRKGRGTCFITSRAHKQGLYTSLERDHFKFKQNLTKSWAGMPMMYFFSPSVA